VSNSLKDLENKMHEEEDHDEDDEDEGGETLQHK